MSDDECEVMQDDLEETYGSPNGYSDVVEILGSAGVNADWV